MHPAGHLVRRKSYNGGLYRVSRTQPFIVILHRNLAFFQTLCGAVPEYIGRRIEAVITGLTRNQLNSKEFRGFESHRLRQVSLLNFTLGSDFFIASLQNSVAFLINISPLLSSSDFWVRYKSYQQSRQIAIHENAQKSVFPFCVNPYFAHKNTDHLCDTGSLDFLYRIRYNSIEI